MFTSKVPLCFIKEQKKAGKRPGTVIGMDGKQILIKHGSFYVTVHSCTWQLEDSFSNNISAQPAHLDPESEILSPWRFSEKLVDINYDYNYHPILIKVQISTNR